MRKVRFVVHQIHSNRVYRVTPEEVEVVLGRLPAEVKDRLREVHFRDDFHRGCVGYANRESGQIALTAVPERMSFRHYQRIHGGTAEEFGAVAGEQWPVLALRRQTLYDTFLHELGHLQIVRPRGRNHFTGERGAREFAAYWRRRLWAEAFDHPDPVHNRPGPDERFWPRATAAWQGGLADAVHALNETGFQPQALRQLKSYHGIPEEDRLYLMGVAHFKSGQWEAAREAFQAMPERPHRDYWLGITLQKLGDWKRACPVLLRALSDEVGGVGARLALAQCCYWTGQTAQAEELLREGLAGEPKNPRYLRMYISLLKCQGRMVEARLQRRILRLLPD